MPSDEPTAASVSRPFADEVRARLSDRLRVVLIAILVGCAIMLPLGWWTDNGQILWTSVAGAGVCAIGLGLRARGHVDTASFLLLVAMVIATTISMAAGEGLHDAGMILYPTIVVVGSLLLPPRRYTLLIGSVVLSVTGVWWLAWTGRTAPRFQDLTDMGDLVSVVTILVIQAIAVNVTSRGLFRSLREARRENEERRTAEEEVRRLNAELERRVEARTAELAAANEDLEAFSYSVSHDLRAPLRIASGYASLLDEEHSSHWEPGARQLLERILASNARMSMLIDELLRFSRLGRKPLVRRLVDMERVARSVVDLLAAGADGRRVQWTIGALPSAWADQPLIEQVYANLVGNSLKYTGPLDEARIEVGFDDDGSGPSYFVRDNGVGFEMSHAGRLFGVFERLHDDEEFEGNGVGLATVQRILAKHGGRIWAHSEPGRGATFRFQIPSEEEAG